MSWHLFRSDCGGFAGGFIATDLPILFGSTTQPGTADYTQNRRIEMCTSGSLNVKQKQHDRA